MISRTSHSIKELGDYLRGLEEEPRHVRTPLSPLPPPQGVSDEHDRRCTWHPRNRVDLSQIPTSEELDRLFWSARDEALRRERGLTPEEFAQERAIALPEDERG